MSYGNFFLHLNIASSALCTELTEVLRMLNPYFVILLISAWISFWFCWFVFPSSLYCPLWYIILFSFIFCPCASHMFPVYYHSDRAHDPSHGRCSFVPQLHEASGHQDHLRKQLYKENTGKMWWREEIDKEGRKENGDGCIRRWSIYRGGLTEGTKEVRGSFLLLSINLFIQPPYLKKKKTNYSICKNWFFSALHLFMSFWSSDFSILNSLMSAGFCS